MRPKDAAQYRYEVRQAHLLLLKECVAVNKSKVAEQYVMKVPFSKVQLFQVVCRRVIEKTELLIVAVCDRDAGFLVRIRM